MEYIEPLKHCRYYHGEESCPDGVDGTQTMFWSLERMWVKGANKDIYNEGYNAEFLMDFPEGIPTAKMPLSMKALFYSRYYHWYGGTDGFIDYIRLYLGSKI